LSQFHSFSYLNLEAFAPIEIRSRWTEMMGHI
jgi:hypothetical protein